MLRYGIPSYRLPRQRLEWDIDSILSAGIEVKLNTDMPLVVLPVPDGIVPVVVLPVPAGIVGEVT